ncbi:MAG: 30S ribosomal protein S8 [Chitinispirillales bacterium]|jgi:small subunit ribosomal protein S8|nr:30S ribosomal protein S8 [Chitinispirillales bacterium]
MITDPIADMFTVIRNSVRAKRKIVTIPASNVKKNITKLLFENGYISKYAFVDDGLQGEIKIILKYEGKDSAIRDIQRISKPSRRVYAPATEIPKVLNGMGTCIVSTSQGIMTDFQCRKNGIGGELIGKVW